MPKSVQFTSEPDFSRGDKGIRKTRKNRKIGFGPFFNRNVLSINSFQLKWATGILRIIRNFLRVGVWGPPRRLKCRRPNAKVMKTRIQSGKICVHLWLKMISRTWSKPVKTVHFVFSALCKTHFSAYFRVLPHFSQL
jgi:hypothetical protein